MVGDRGMIGIGMVGYAFMGRAHSQAWRSAVRFFDLPVGHEPARAFRNHAPDEKDAHAEHRAKPKAQPPS